MNKPKPIFVTDLFFKIDEKLIELLKNLTLEQWSLQTIAPKWKVKDIAVHLLDGNLRALSMLRDGYFGESPENVDNYESLLQYLNQLNADWVKAMKRLSPSVIIGLLESSGREYCEYMKTVAPFEKATFSVAWAGEAESQNWFHLARDYTEKWHHQQQIRLAVGEEAALLADEFYHPYLDTSVRALPHHYRNVAGKEGTIIQFVFKGASDKIWYLKWADNAWELLLNTNEPPSTTIIIKDEIAWRIFTKGISPSAALDASEIKGIQRFGRPIFDMLAVMA